MGHRALFPGTVTVRLARCSGHGVAGANELGRLTAQLHEALALNDVENLTPAVTVPVVASTGLEADDGDPNRVGVKRHVQWVGARRPGEVSRVDGLAVERLTSCDDLHVVIVKAGAVCCLSEIGRPGARWATCRQTAL